MIGLNPSKPGLYSMYINRSHERCKSVNIDVDRMFSSRVLTGDELNGRLIANQKLILTAAPYMDQLYGFVKGSNFFAILTDQEGCILSVIGDEEILSRAKKLKMAPGAFMDEKSIGTNAMSLALTESLAVQISGEDHFIKAYHKWTCSAAPIRYKDGRIAGILDLTGYSECVHPHTLGMVVAAANAIEQMLKIEEYNRQLEISKNHVETIIHSIPSAILTSDLSGSIGTVNKYVTEMFGYSEEEMKNMDVRDLFEGFDTVLDTLICKGNFLNEDVYVNARKNKLQFNLSAYPVSDAEKNITEIIYVFMESQKARKLAGKILSGRAIYTFDKIIGRSDNFLKTIEYARKISDSRSTILITGESGTGKEVFSQSIHNHSRRENEPFIAVNCGAIPRDLIESELFGYEEGAFTGAKRGGYAGKFQIADGGTMFLDEIGEMPMDMQVKLLRVIEEGIISRIGSTRQVPVDVRIIAATNKDLGKEVDNGNFRKDLFYRLNVLPLYLLPLRERREDIPLLVEYFMKKISKHLNKRMVDIPDHYIEQFKNYDWPGNIRELENIIELIINTESMPDLLEKKGQNQNNDYSDLKDTFISLNSVERRHIIRILEKCKGNISLAAKALGIGRNTLYRKIESYNIDCPILEQCSIMEQQN